MNRRIRTGGFYFGVVCLVLFSILPILYAVITTFKKNSELFDADANPFIYEQSPTIDHLVFLFTDTQSRPRRARWPWPPRSWPPCWWRSPWCWRFPRPTPSRA